MSGSTSAFQAEKMGSNPISRSVKPANQKLRKSWEGFTDILILKTILDNLADEEVRQVFELTSQGKSQAVQKLILKEIPDLEEKLKKETKKQLKVILEKSQNERN